VVDGGMISSLKLASLNGIITRYLDIWLLMSGIYEAEISRPFA
jgi:hypothetical protein